MKNDDFFARGEAQTALAIEFVVPLNMNVLRGTAPLDHGVVLRSLASAGMKLAEQRGPFDRVVLEARAARLLDSLPDCPAAPADVAAVLSEFRLTLLDDGDDGDDGDAAFAIWAATLQ